MSVLPWRKKAMFKRVTMKYFDDIFTFPAPVSLIDTEADH